MTDHVTEYPGAERLDLIDEIHGTRVADPYRWLEEGQDPRTLAWGEQQDALYAAWLARATGSAAPLGRLRRRIEELADAGSVSVPVWRGGRHFLTRRDPGRELPVLLVVEADGTERALLDPAALDASGTTTLDGWFPSADGALLAYFLSVGGTERPRLRVLEVASGRDVDGPIDGVVGHDLAWLADGSGFYYQRRPSPQQILDGIRRVHVLVYLHRIGDPPTRDVLISRPELGLPASAWFTPAVSGDGRWLRLDAESGVTHNDVYLADLTACAPEAPVFVDLAIGQAVKTDLFFGEGGRRIYALTFADAPNGRLCLVSPERPAYEHWRTLLPEDPGAVLKGFTILGGEGMPRPRLLALKARHALSELALYDLGELEEPGGDRVAGPAGAAVRLPGLGTVSALAWNPGTGPCAYFGYADFATPPSVYRFDGRTGTLEQWAAAPGGPVSADIQVRQVTYRSYDGTRVRMFILSPAAHPPAAGADRPRPAVLYGYGAHGSSRVPGFNPLQVAWVEAGGVYAVANIRGGGEEGEAWHRAGIREHRQNTFADFHAAADHLVDQGWTTRDRLGVHGGSAGGQLVGVVVTQRPGAYRAALCSAPQLDMVRAELAGAAELWTAERGTARDPEQFGWLLAQSPYHLVKQGTEYPAILVTTFDGDARVAAWHARKFVAAAQHATASAPGERPILLRREAGVGHVNRSASRAVGLWSEQIGFLAEQLGLADAG